jgi:hypothetical protein
VQQADTNAETIRFALLNSLLPNTGLFGFPLLHLFHLSLRCFVQQGQHAIRAFRVKQQALPPTGQHIDETPIVV